MDRLSKEDMERMVAEAEEHAEQDNVVRPTCVNLTGFADLADHLLCL